MYKNGGLTEETNLSWTNCTRDKNWSSGPSVFRATGWHGWSGLPGSADHRGQTPSYEWHTAYKQSPFDSKSLKLLTQEYCSLKCIIINDLRIFSGKSWAIVGSKSSAKHADPDYPARRGEGGVQHRNTLGKYFWALHTKVFCPVLPVSTKAPFWTSCVA